MEKCRRMKRPQCTSKNWIYSWLSRSSKTRQQSYRSESFAMKTDILWVDQRSRTTSHQKRDSDSLQHGELRSDRGSRLVSKFFIQFSSFNFNDTFKAGNWSSHIFLKFVYFTNYNSIKRQWDSRKGRSEWDRFPSSGGVKFTCWRDDRTVRPVVCTQANQKPKTK